jgi:hypothetical protein
VIAEVLNSYALTIDYLESLIADLPADALAGQRNGVVNHPLWTIGHLVHAAQMQPLPDGRYREMFPTLGHAVTHVLTAHTAAHIGQVIVWRRVMGFPPLAKVYD